MFPRRRTLYAPQGNLRGGAQQRNAHPVPVRVPAVQLPQVPNIQQISPGNTPPPSPPPSPPPQPVGPGPVIVPRPGRFLDAVNDFQIVFCHEILEENFTSNSVIAKIFRWMRKNRPNERDRLSESQFAHIQKTITEILQYKRTVFCASCSRVVVNLNSQCSTVGCGRYRQRKNRMRINKLVVLDSVDLRSYMETVMGRMLEALLDSHGEIHNVQHSLEDIRFSPAVREHIETPQQYQRGLIIVPLAFYTDAFTFKSLQKGSSWPVLLSFLSLPAEMRQRLTNMLIPYLISSGVDPPMSVWRLIVVKLLRFLRVVERRPLRLMSANGRQITIKFTLPFHSMDLKAICQLFSMSGWAGYFGCPRCLLRGHQHGRRGLKWPTGQNAALRTTSRLVQGGVFHDADRRINGFRGTSPFLQLFSPSMLLPDPLHCIAEGILKEVYKGAVEGGGRQGLVLTPGGRAALDLLSGSVHVSLNSRVILVGSTEFNCATGSEREAIFCTIFCVCLMNIDNVVSPYTSSLALFLGVFVRFVQSHKLNATKVNQIQDVMVRFFEAHRVFFGSHYDTMKFHQLEHFMYLLPWFGSPYTTSTSSGEAANRLLKMDAPSQSTRNFHTQAFKKCISKQVLLGEIEARSAEGSQECENYLREGTETALDRIMRNRVYTVNGLFYSPADRRTPDHMAPAELQAYAILRAAAPGYGTYLSRFGCGFNVFNSKSYGRAVETQRHFALVYDNLNYSVAEILLLALCDQTGNMVACVKLFPTSDPIERLQRDVARYAAFRNERMQPHVIASLRLLEGLSRVNSFYFEFTLHHTVAVVLCSQIVAPLSVMSANGRSFAVNMLSQIYHE